MPGGAIVLREKELVRRNIDQQCSRLRQMKLHRPQKRVLIFNMLQHIEHADQIQALAEWRMANVALQERRIDTLAGIDAASLTGSAD